MRRATKMSIALVTVGVLALSACGNSTAQLLESTKTKNAALDSNAGLNVKAMTFKRESLQGWESHPWGQGIEDQIVRDESKLIACPSSTPTSVTNIDAAPLATITKACQAEFLVVHYTGFVTVPGTAGEDVKVKFRVAKDDTFFMNVDGATIINAWNNTGCAWVEGTTTLKAGKKYPLDAWFSQFRGGICNQMTWSLNGGANEIVPQSALSRVDDTPAPTTTTTVAETTTTTTVEEKAAGQNVVTTTTVVEEKASGAAATTTTTVAESTATENAATATTVAAAGEEATTDTMATTDEEVATEASDTTVAAAEGTDAMETEATETDSDSSSSNTLLYLALGLGLILLIWFIIARRRRDEDESSTKA